MTESPEEQFFQDDASSHDPDDPFGEVEVEYVKPLVVASVVGLIGAVVWAVVAVVTGFEIGWLAILLGASIGGVAMRMAGYPTRELGIASGAIAAGAILCAKLLIGTVGAHHMAADEFAGDDTLMVELAMLEKVEEGETSDAFKTWWESPEAEATPEVAAEYEKLEKDLGYELAGLTRAEKRDRARPYMSRVLEDIPLTDRMGLGPFDIVWLVIAVGAAFKIGSGTEF